MLQPPERTSLLHVSEDPDRAWAEYGGHLLHEARMYASWQSAGIRSAVRSSARDAAALREEGVYRIVTPDECLALARQAGGQGSLILHPLCGGCPSTRAGARCICSPSGCCRASRTDGRGGFQPSG